MQEFRTHTGEMVQGERLQEALHAVADDWESLGYTIRQKNAYASHVREATKINNLERFLSEADRIRQGEIQSFTIWQRVNEKLTGECVALLPR